MHRIDLRYVLSLALASCVLLSSSTVTAQDTTAKEAKPAAKAAKGRLPPYYKDVVTDKQKASIYELQKSYSERIDALEEQLTALQDKRDAEIAALLTADQKAQIEKLRADAGDKKKRKAKAAEETVAASDGVATTAESGSSSKKTSSSSSKSSSSSAK